ncbi:uncharacterized protein CBL_11839 [Carabus blaptoides fortunei]
MMLASDIDFGVNAQPVKLPGSSSVPPGDVDSVLIGWGLTASIGGISPNILKKINYTKFSDEYCERADPRYNPNHHVCAGIIGGGKGQCSLESDIDFGECAQPVILPSSSSVPAGDFRAVLIGWGLTASVNGTYPLILKKINYIKFSDKYCKGTEPLYNPNYHVCAGIIGGGIGQCIVSVQNQFSVEN